MLVRQGRLIEALDRVAEFLTTSGGPRLAAIVTSAAHDHLTASRARMVAHMTTQDAAARSTRDAVGQARRLRAELLRSHLRPIGVIARKRLPGARDTQAFRVPTVNSSFSAVVAAGFGMAEAARAHEAALLAAGAPVGFIDRLLEATAALRDAVTAKGQSRARRQEATAGLRKEGVVARGALSVLDVLVRAAVRDDDVLIDRWRAVRRVAVVGVTPRESEPSEPAPEVGGPAPIIPLTGATEARAVA